LQLWLKHDWRHALSGKQLKFAKHKPNWTAQGPVLAQLTQL